MAPQSDDTFNGVIDLSHHNGKVDLQKAADSGIVGVIHKATQGQDYVDPTFTVKGAYEMVLVGVEK
jgi:GH25 family lysozyme M1 (1,4-beta-N-acetylmuramidase)